MHEKDQQVQTKQNNVQKANGKKLENSFTLLFFYSTEALFSALKSHP